MNTRILVLESTLKEYERELKKWRDSAERRLKRENNLKCELRERCEQLRIAHDQIEVRDRKLKRAREVLDSNE